MMTTFHAIQTSYKGYRFRSRLEARWAVCFDHLQIPWTYEPEGYRLSNGEMYLPDFGITLKNWPVRLAVEIKGNLANFDGWAKLEEFAMHRQLLVLGDIPEPMVKAPLPLFTLMRGCCVDTITYAWFAFVGNGVADEVDPADYRSQDCVRVRHASRAVEDAFKAARSARFEHGETP